MILENQPWEFFSGLVKRSLNRFGNPVTEDSEVYVVGIMVTMVQKNLDSESLCIRILEPKDPRLIILKEAGDEALFISGFFPSRLTKMGLSKGYYASLGSMAYSELGSRSSTGLNKIFLEISNKFRVLQDALGDARITVDKMVANNMEQQYRDHRTNSEASGGNIII